MQSLKRVWQSIRKFFSRLAANIKKGFQKLFHRQKNIPAPADAAPVEPVPEVHKEIPHKAIGHKIKAFFVSIGAFFKRAGLAVATFCSGVFAGIKANRAAREPKPVKPPKQPKPAKPVAVSKEPAQKPVKTAPAAIKKPEKRAPVSPVASVREPMLPPAAPTGQRKGVFHRTPTDSQALPPVPKPLKPSKKDRRPAIAKEHMRAQRDRAHVSVFVPRMRPPWLVLNIVFTSIKIFGVLAVAIMVAGVGVLVGVAKAYQETTPTLDTGKIEEQALNSYIYDSNGKLITTFAGLENRVWATLNEIPEELQQAFIAVEDVRFEYHNGVDIKRIVGSFINNMTGDRVEGASTITQQLIKNRILSPERSYKRKLQEAYLAMELEKQYTKDEILESYLNAISLGDGNYGVKTAAEDYLGKSVEDLTLKESAMIAGITRNPTQYNPRRNYYGAGERETTDKRTNVVLMAMYQAGYISWDEYEEARDEPLRIKEKSTVRDLYDMPYFVEYAITDVVSHMLKANNLEDTQQNRTQMENELRNGGYSIYTTVDPEIQQTVQQIISEYDRYPHLADSDDEIYLVQNADGSVTQVEQPQAAAVIYDYHTGFLKAIIGGRYPPLQKKQFNRATMSHTTVGSSIKPIAVYAPALDMGLGAGSSIDNSESPITGWGAGRGYPGGAGNNGPVTLRSAVVGSYNRAAARLLLEYVTVENSMTYMQNLGIEKQYLNPDGPGLALGTSGITPLEMAVGFGTLGNRGEYLEPLSFTKVVDSRGEVYLDAAEIQQKRQVYQPSTAWMITDILTDAVQSGTGSEARIDDMTVAGKTGTNDDYKGIYFCGYTPYYSASLWIGHDGNKSLQNSYGGRYAAPLWSEFMTAIHEGLEDKPIIADDPETLGLSEKSICSVSGLLAGGSCSDILGNKPSHDWFRVGRVPTGRCDAHTSVTLCAVSGGTVTEYCPADVQQSFNILKDSTSEQTSKLSAALGVTATPDAVCSVHTAAWYEQQQLLTEAYSRADAALSSAYAYLDSYAGTLDEATVSGINAAIAALQGAINSGDVSAINSAISALSAWLV